MTIGPERLNLWLSKPVPGGRAVQLVHDQAVGAGLMVAMWSKEEIDEAKAAGTTLAEHMLDAAQEHADTVGESCRFLLQWVNDQMRPIRTMVHKVLPSERPSNEHALAGDAVSLNAMVGQLLGHIATQQKVINGSIGVVLAAYDRAMAMQTGMLEQLARRVNAEPVELSEADAQVQTLKAQALQKLIDLGPDVVRLGLNAIETAAERRRVSPELERQAFAMVAEEAKKKNGAAAAAAAPSLPTETKGEPTKAA